MQKFWEPDRGGGVEEGGSTPPPPPLPRFVEVGHPGI